MDEGLQAALPGGPEAGGQQRSSRSDAPGGGGEEQEDKGRQVLTIMADESGRKPDTDPAGSLQLFCGAGVQNAVIVMSFEDLLLATSGRLVDILLQDDDHPAMRSSFLEVQNMSATPLKKTEGQEVRLII